MEVPVTEEQNAKIMEDIFKELHGAPVPDRTPDPLLEKAVELLRSRRRS